MLAEDGAQRRRGGELPDFVENGSGRFGAVPLVVLRVLPYPKPRRDRIAHARHRARAELLVGVEARQVNERGARRREQRHDAVE